MSTPAKKIYEKLTLPAGRARWIAVNKPLTTHKPEGEYSVDVVLTPEQAKPLIAKFEELAKIEGIAASKDDKFKLALKKARSKAKDDKLMPGKTLPIVPELDAEGNETGNFVARCKQKGQYTRKDQSIQNVVITIVDSNRKPMKANLGKGSLVRVATAVVPYFSAGLLKYGVSLRIEGVQVIELVEYRGGADVNTMFNDEEGGYVADQSTAVADGDGSPAGPAGAASPAGGSAEADFA